MNTTNRQNMGELKVAWRTSNAAGYEQRLFLVYAANPEDLAMVQAMYSRSPATVMSHLNKVIEVGSGKFMGQYYVGYGHASIGDCGVVTVFAENYSMLAAKAVQDNPLYSGQEASTRYLDFAEQPQADPYNTPASRAVMQGWLALYNELMPQIKNAIALERPYDPAQYKTEKVWENAVKARAFDILRSLLPIGTTTLLSWTTNLRQARDNLVRLKNHPLAEVRQLAADMFQLIYGEFPNSFNGEELTQNGRYAERDAYAQKFAVPDAYFDADTFPLDEATKARLLKGEVLTQTHMLDVKGAAAEAEALSTRPRGADLSRRFMRYGVYRLQFLLDFGSYRDLQRHRNGLGQIPLVDARFGFMPWYEGELKRLLGEAWPQVRARIDVLLAQCAQGDRLKDTYLYPMGVACLTEVTYSIPQMVYVAELRSQTTVHPSLRPIAQAMGAALKQCFPNMALYVDDALDAWNPRRGEQTIEAKHAA